MTVGREYDSVKDQVFFSKYADEGETSLIDRFNTIKRELLKIETEANFNRGDYNSLFDNERMIPGGRIMFGMGRPMVSYSNCYVIEIADDSIDEIFETAKKQAIIFKFGGGVGIDISNLRPRGARTKIKNAQPSTGAVSFIPLYNIVTEIVGQMGRRGALMITISIEHPDIMEFIEYKRNLKAANFCNMSVRMTNRFMKIIAEGNYNKYLELSGVEAEEAIKSGLYDDDWTTEFQTRHEKIVKTYKIRDVWKAFVESNYLSGEPGMIIWDTMIDMDPASIIPGEKAVSTNPCGEQALPPYGACNLNAINFSTFVKNSFTNESYFDTEDFIKTCKDSVRFLDTVIEGNLSRHPLRQNTEQSKNGRRIGVGVMGLADALIRLGIKYDSDEAIEWCDKYFKIFQIATLEASIDLAIERGPFGVWNELTDEIKMNYINHPFFNVLSEEYKEKMIKYGIRNVGTTTVAPTGSISNLFEVNGGLEPFFRFEYDRRLVNQNNRKIRVLAKVVKDYENSTNKSYKDNSIFVSSDMIDWQYRVRLQSVIQKHISQSISSTINLPSTTKMSDISGIYVEAWKQGLKGITVYRDNSRENVLSDVKTVETPKEAPEIKVLESVKISQEYDSKLTVIRAEGKKWYVHYELDPETKLPFSMFIDSNNNESENAELTNEVIEVLSKLATKFIPQEHIDSTLKKIKRDSNVKKTARIVSLLLRHRVPLIKIIESIDSIQPSALSLIYRLKSILSTYLPNGIITDHRCPECNELLRRENGCLVCTCGFSKCG